MITDKRKDEKGELIKQAFYSERGLKFVEFR